MWRASRRPGRRVILGTILALGWYLVFFAPPVGASSGDNVCTSLDAMVSLAQTVDRDASAIPWSWSRCWVQQADLSPSHAAAAAEFLQPEGLVTHVGWRISERLARGMFHTTGRTAISADALVSLEIPVWRVHTLAPIGSEVGALTVRHDDGACLPYPISAVTMTAQSLVRGRTAALQIETDQLAFCRATYLDQVERCYRDGDRRLIVLFAVSALADPGVYPLEIELVTGGQARTFAIPLVVTAGRYGFQYIDPPPDLSGLLDADLMASEAAYLARWRSLRSMTRRWDLPLAAPLERAMPISADFGDRRSYGGMVEGYHSGVDYRVSAGVPVVSPADGVVVMTEALDIRGNTVLIDHGWGLVTGYWHLSKVHVKVGDFVERGQTFAEVGNTGLSTGAHLHWEVWINGVSVDGKQWLDPDILMGISLLPYAGPDSLIDTSLLE
jgi:hypothetical protein